MPRPKFPRFTACARHVSSWSISGVKRFFSRALQGLRLLWLGAVLLPLPGWMAEESAPVLVSQKGGGGTTWASVAELATDAAKNNPHACAALGEALLRGNGVPQDVPRALALLEQAARAGIGLAAFRLGMLLDDGQGVAQDRRRALDYFRAGAAGGVTEAFFNVGAAYVGAHGVKRDYTEGLAWLILATQRGADKDTEQTVRARIQKLRHPEWIAAAEKRASLIEDELAATTVAAQLPPPVPLVATGFVPAVGSGAAAPLDKNAPVFKLPAVRAAANSSAPSPEPAEGPPVKLVLPTGRNLSWPSFTALERAADRSEPGAPAALGQALLAGQLAPADPIRAVAILERAAQAGSADAAHLLAELYTNGDKVPRDDAKAFAYNLQAARGGSLQAIFNTGALYANARGTARDYTAALTWLIVAKHYHLDLGGAEKRIRAQVEKTEPAQISVAEKRAAELQREIEAVVADPKRP